MHQTQPTPKKPEPQNVSAFLLNEVYPDFLVLGEVPFSPNKLDSWKVALSCLGCLKKPCIGVKYHINYSFIRPSIGDFVFFLLIFCGLGSHWNENPPFLKHHLGPNISWVTFFSFSIHPKLMGGRYTYDPKFWGNGYPRMKFWANISSLS